jgi:hypothetical protein
MLQLSRFLKVRSRDGLVAVFNELRPDPLYFTGRQMAFFHK